MKFEQKNQCEDIVGCKFSFSINFGSPSDLDIPEHILSTIKDKPTLTSAGLKHAFDLVGSNGQIDSLGLVRKLFRKHPEQAEFLLEYVDVDKVERITNFLLNLLPQSTGKVRSIRKTKLLIFFPSLTLVKFALE